ncbi:multiple C2 and transmembrane domain-containing protein [Plutella xylostella]|uniref:multiple C2 and transmembrane domain-containing protein n=1 Tax=Plutella xylostella TaxID=51655 RepID=UPI0020329C2D|nr:multiple C2 and transmembrane domain-containing protein [Plutella xylostella]
MSESAGEEGSAQPLLERRGEVDDEKEKKVTERKSSTLPSSSRRVNILRPASFSNFLGVGPRRLRAADPLDSALVPLEQKVNTLNVRHLPKGSAVVSIVLVEARGLPDPPADGASHGIYCKFSLGSESFKSKVVPNTRQPQWKQRFKLSFQRNTLLKISLWDKGRQKNFMGGCTLDLLELEPERTHERWQPLDDGFGSVHFALTMCIVGKEAAAASSDARLENVAVEKYSWLNIKNLKEDWSSVGQLSVRVHGAKGLAGRPSAYCILELDNERVQTHNAGSSAEPVWNKDFVFNVRDVTTTLDIKVHDNSMVNIISDGFLGKVSIPLCRVRSTELRWYALKDRSKRNCAKGNCPRILLELNMVWHPIKATAKMFRPKEVKYIKKSKKFDIALVYNNVEFIRDTFIFLLEINEGYKRLFEWESREFSCIALTCWVLFWFFFQIWMLPLLLLLPFLYFGLRLPSHDDSSDINQNSEVVEPEQHNEKNDKSITGRMLGLPEMTLTITDGIEYIASVAERFVNLVTFKVPFLSQLAIVLLLGAALVLYVVPFNYLLIAFGVYKFTRKYLHPDRELNNDIVDFISHLPDNDVLKDWKELKVPEPAPCNGTMNGTTKVPVQQTQSNK